MSNSGARPAIRVETVDFAQWREAIYRIRTRVFVQEQGVPEEIERDLLDPDSLHVLAWAGAEAVGTGRLTPRGRIGRMAVLGPHRGRGVGTRMLEQLTREATKTGLGELVLASQLSARGFYRRLGFAAQGEVFVEAGIDHILMRKALDRG